MSEPATAAAWDLLFRSLAEMRHGEGRTEAPATRRDVCGCDLLTDDEGDYADCRECEGHGIDPTGHPCFHCDGAGHHDVGGGVVLN